MIEIQIVLGSGRCRWYRSVMTSEHELWAVSLWVEKHHRDDGPDYIADQIESLSLEGDREGVDMWLKVAERFEALNEPSAHA